MMHTVLTYTVSVKHFGIDCGFHHAVGFFANKSKNVTT